MCKLIGKKFLLLVLLTSVVNALMAQNDLPSPTANMKQVKAGSLIISMDTVLQKRPGYFNMKAYGLVNTLLQNEIPVIWSIRSGKTRTSVGSVDFTVTTTRVFPDTASLGSQSFRSGPFIIDSAWVSKALPLITAFGNNVNVYRADANFNGDIRYTLTHKPRILLLNTEGYDTIAVKMLQEAGFDAGSYRLQTPSGSGFNPSGNWSVISETHTTSYDTAKFNPLLRYAVQRGANLFINCTAIGAMENSTFTMTTAGVDSFTTGLAATNYLNHDLPIAQFLGTIQSPNGEFKLWKPKSGSSMRSNTYEFMRGGSGANLYCMAGMKLRPNTLAGGNLFYVSGHEHYHWSVATGSQNDMVRINGRRVFLNAMFIPASDSIDGIDFKTDVTIDKVPQPGLAVKNEPFRIYVVASNAGPGTARNLSIAAPLPAGLTYASSSVSRGSYNPVTGVWTLDSLRKNQTDTLTLNVTISALGTISYISNISNESLEYIKTNNRDTLILFGVSRPDAVNDTLHFTAASFADYNVRGNDSDEDGGPFTTTTILAGPYNGAAVLLNGDSIRYTLWPGFTGIDSIKYVSCDNYPLCDTAWYYIVVASPLPVSLMNFGGFRDGTSTNLYWFTASEKNNDYFRIERSMDGRSFEYRGKVQGNGTTNQIKGYNFSEEDSQEPFLYYRLVQVDYDGTRSSSPVIALPLKKGGKFKAEIYPNPSEGCLQVIRAQGVSGVLRVSVSDISGRILINDQWTADESGVITSLFNSDQRLTPGSYIATFQTEHEQQSVRVIIR
ncbi:MAG: Ig-like domain-containing protein [Bacteroidia bacterium]